MSEFTSYDENVSKSKTPHVTASDMMIERTSMKQ